MKLTAPETAIDWSEIARTTIPGASAAARIRTFQANDAQLRIVEYDPGYLADHWCGKGHILYVISGALTIEHQDGAQTYEVSAGASWCSADGHGSPHRVRSEHGATVFIVD